MKPLPFARSAKAARKTRLNLMPDWAEVKLEKRALLAVVTWDGGAGTMNWGDAANWDGDNLPTSTDDVVIPDLAGVQTINVNITTGNAKTLNSVENVTIQASQSLTLRDGTSQVSGVFTVSPGGTLVAESGSVFTPTGAVTIDGADLYARDSGTSGNGGKLNLAAATSYVNSNRWRGRIEATGGNSLIDLSGLSSVKNGGVSGTPMAGLDITVSAGGKIDLKNVTQISAGAGGGQSIWMTASDNSTSWGWYPEGTSRIFVNSGATIISPELKTLSTVEIYHNGGSMDVSRIESMTGGGIIVNAGTVNYTSLVRINSADITNNGGTIGLSTVSNFDSTSLWVGGGRTIDLSQVTSYKNPSRWRATFQATQPGSQINLSGLQEIINGGVSGTPMAGLDITVSAGGKIDLKNVTQISAGAGGGQSIWMTASDN
ncbi:MAG: hypothetical protein NT172_18450, partial [Planctomycetota bacterium]|nr:hypothetical protein [Planctomycetota bacterium]